jgi:hypothetical protein
MQASPLQRRISPFVRKAAAMKRVLVALVPVVMLTLAVPFVNRVEPRVLGLPFVLAWILFWIVCTPLAMSIVARLDRAR